MNGSPFSSNGHKDEETGIESRMWHFPIREVGEERPDSSSDIWRKRKLLKPMLWQFPLFLESSSIPEHRKVGNRRGEGGRELCRTVVVAFDVTFSQWESRFNSCV